MADEANKEKPKKKHTPGKDHNRKSQPRIKARIGKRLRERHQKKSDQARKEWEEYDKLSPELRRLLGPKGEPKLERPKDDN